MIGERIYIWEVRVGPRLDWLMYARLGTRLDSNLCRRLKRNIS